MTKLTSAADDLEKAAVKLLALVDELRQTEKVDRDEVFQIRLEVVLVAGDLREVNEHLLALADKLLS